MPRQAISRHAAKAPTPNQNPVRVLAAWREMFVVLGLLGVTLVAQGPQFEVASIKRNTTGFVIGGAPTPPSVNGRINMTNIPVLTMLARAYSKVSVPIEIVGLPAWAQSNRFDVALQADPKATPEQLEAMWRALLVDRMKVAAHYEMREKRGYDLVMARPDGTLGPQLKPSACPASDPSKPRALPSRDLLQAAAPGRTPMSADTERLLMTQCGFALTVGYTTYSGGLPIASLINGLHIGGGVSEPIEDHTGLTGMYAYKLTYSHGSTGLPDPDAPPLIFTALQEQLGLKLERAPAQVQIIVVDHIEPPTEN